MEKKPKIYFHNLDGLRTIAFAFVFLQHGFGNIFKDVKINNSYINKIISFLFFSGGMGVSIFFVLSGFLITFLIITEINLNGKLDLKAFYLRRTLRIWPLYFCVVIFAFEIYPYLKYLIGIHSDLCSRSLFYYFFLSNFDIIHVNETCPGQESMMEAITWSVAIEEQFYLVWPLFFILIPKKKLIYFFYFVIISSLIFRVLHVNDDNILYLHTLSICGDLAIGGLGAYYIINADKFKNFFINIKPKTVLIFYLLGIFFYFFNPEFDFKYFKVVKRIIFDLFFLFIILEQSFSSYTRFKLRNLRLISSAGKYTYGYYLLHPFAIMLVYNIFRLLDYQVIGLRNILISGTIALIITLVISYLSYKYFESYFIRLKHNFSYISSK